MCLLYTINSSIYQGVVTYRPHVEAFVTENKIESSDQSPFGGGGGGDQGINVTSKLLKSTDQERATAI